MTALSRIHYFDKGKDVVAVVDYLKKGNLRMMDFVPIAEADIKSYPSPEGRIIIPDEKAVLVWGDGTKHGISYFFRPNGPYFKSVSDAHSDFDAGQRKNDGNDRVGCLNHNSALLLYDENLLGLEVLGVRMPPHREILRSDSVNGKVVHSRISTGISPNPNFSNLTLHQSTDLDVIEGYPCDELFAAGRNSSESVKKSLEKLFRNNNVVRFDLGGFCMESPYAVSGPASGLKEYEELIELYLAYN